MNGKAGQLSFKVPLVELVLFVGAMGQLTVAQIAGRTPTMWWADLAMLFAVMLTLTRRFSHEQMRDRRTQWVVCWMTLYIAVNLATLCLSIDLLFSLAILKLIAAPLLALLIAFCDFRSERSVDHFLNSLPWCGALIGAIMIVNWRSYASGAAVTEIEGIKEMAQSSLGRNNSIASILAFVFPLGLRAMLSGKSSRWLSAAACLAVIGLALTLTMSRGAVISLGLGLCVMALCGARGGSRYIAKVAVLGALVYLVLIATVPADVWSTQEYRFSTLDESFDTRNEGHRMEKLVAAWPFIAKSPLWGIGVGNQAFLVYVGGGSSHNVLMDALLESGILGFFCLTAALAALGLTVVDVWRRATTQQSRLRAATLLGAFTAAMLNALQEPTFFALPEFAYMFWFTMAACLALRRMHQGSASIFQRAHFQTI